MTPESSSARVKEVSSDANGTGYGRWTPLRAFASQGDAREFAERDVPRFTDAQLSALAKTCAGRRYSRRGFMNYRKIF